ncbi:MAG TPA: hypothetical protein VNY06_07475, partial [Methylocella sp.]|nr:hypothetical protein [Methylocella sp.]
MDIPAHLPHSIAPANVLLQAVLPANVDQIPAMPLPQKQRGEYLSLRREFEPTSVRLVIVAESPPISGNYFYNPDGEVSEQLFKALMEQLGIK